MSHDSSEIILICWFAAQETSLIIINVENSCAASYCIRKHGSIIFYRILWWIESLKEQHLIKWIRSCWKKVLISFGNNHIDFWTAKYAWNTQKTYCCTFAKLLQQICVSQICTGKKIIIINTILQPNWIKNNAVCVFLKYLSLGTVIRKYTVECNR